MKAFEHEAGSMMISAIILAAGQSRRMGRPKLLLPWGSMTVLQSVMAAFQKAGLEDILVITGAQHEAVERLVGSLAQAVYNPDFAAGEMLSSIQGGLAARMNSSDAAIIALGDQPQVQAETIERILQAADEGASGLVVPSHDNHRGHPWFVRRDYWEEIIGMRAPASMRDFFQLHQAEIKYVPIDNPSILADIDTPEDYLKYQP
jgi:molybdenum cofactor cytidylyltransferase